MSTKPAEAPAQRTAAGPGQPVAKAPPPAPAKTPPPGRPPGAGGGKGQQSRRGPPQDRPQQPAVVRLAPPAPDDPGAAAPQRPPLRRLSARLLPFAAAVLVPLALAAVYYLAVATERYVSEARFTVRQNAPGQVPSFDLGGLLTGVGSPARDDAFIIRDYILSADMLRVLDREMDLRAAYRDEAIDRLSRLPADASDEDFLEYYRGMVEVAFDDASSIVTVRLQGFDPGHTRATLDLILAESERLVNELSRKLARQELEFFEAEVAQAEARLRLAERRVLAYQNELEMVDPATSSEAVMGIIAELEAQLARDQAELKALRTYVRADAPQVVALESRIAALAEQIAAERRRLAGVGGGARLNDATAGFEAVRLEQQFALEAYKGTVAALEAARIEASKKLKNVVVVVTPNRPDEALYPRRARALGTIAVVLVLLYGVGALVVATIRDHID